MCGILGHFSTGESRADPRLWCRLVGLLAHRGPDDGTFWHDDRFTFGHRRLSIIDLSQGGQPMATLEGDLVVTFNGEIYNYVELRQELARRGHRFHTQSDTEVLLLGYREWGTDLPSKLLGMFAFAIADRGKQQLFAARDRFGEKPFLYIENRNGVAFASELKVLDALPDGDRTIDEQSLGSYLCLNYVPGNATMLRSVRRLPCGSWRLWSANGSTRSGTYWRPPDPNEPPLDIRAPEALQQLEALLDESARLSLRSDVPVGIFLSGGIDSSLIARSAARAGSLATAYCLTFDEPSYSEWQQAQRVAAQLGIPIVEVKLTADALNDFYALVDHADDPLADSSGLAVWTLAKRASQDVKVVLSGDGGDELFGGYLTYRATWWHEHTIATLPNLVRRLVARVGSALPTTEKKVSLSYKLWRFARAAHLTPAIAHVTWNGTWRPEDAARLVSDPITRRAARGALADLAASHRLPERPTLRELQAFDAIEHLPNDILVKSDRMSMAHGLEVRAPLLAAPLAEFALRLPASMKMSARGGGKIILRRLAARTYDVSVTSAGKQGFSIPVHSWLRGPGRPLVDDLLSRESLANIPQLNGDAVRRTVDDHMAGRRSYGFELWGLAVLSRWHQRFVQSRIEVPSTADARIVDIRPVHNASVRTT